MLKIKLSELEWKKFEIIYQEWDNDIIDYSKTFELIKTPCLLKTKNNEIISVGDINKIFGSCGCCSNIKFEDIKEYVNIKIEK